MATAQQIKILDVIHEERRKARANHLNVAEELSGGQRKYKTAINTIISVGALSMVLAAITCAISAYSYYTFFSNGYQLNTWGWVLLILQCLATITTFILGLKLYQVDATPVYVLVSLIIILLSNLLLFSGILPWITAGFSVVGIVCWNTYKNWFNDIDVPSAKKNRRKK